MILVTKPFLPSAEVYKKYLDEIWSRNWLTNNGPLVKEYEQELKDYLDLGHLLYLANGTVALQIAIKALELRGEIITTPFSYVATTSSIVWEGSSPVFIDIDPETLNIDSTKIEEAITPATRAILATHCFGNACNIEHIEEIAARHDLKVIYDAAHCFGTRYKGKSILEYGDISTLSLHATKLIHSVEGGCVVTNSADLTEKMSRLRNFGHSGSYAFDGIGINGKNSELHAAMGLAVLQSADEILQRRKQQCEFYDGQLQGTVIKRPVIQEHCDFNYAYYPLIFENEVEALKVKDNLEKNNVFARRYFYPGLNTLDYVKHVELPVSDACSRSILCLPLYHHLTREEQSLIASVVAKSVAN